MSQSTIRITEDQDMKKAFEAMSMTGQYEGLKKPQILRMAFLKMFRKEVMPLLEQLHQPVHGDLPKNLKKSRRQAIETLKLELEQRWQGKNKTLTFTQEEIDDLSF